MTQALALNPEQRAAVEHDSGPLLVIAGAGSGKTRVLTARVAWLLERGVSPSAILAFTFTNRAAREMRERIASLVGPAAQELWVGTFHATAVRILRREASVLGIAPGFAIYDREDQEDLLGDVLRELELTDPAYRVAAVLGRISDAKNALVTPAEMARVAMTPHEQRIARCYARYQDELRRNGALDFDDLIAETVRLFRFHPEVAERYGRRFEHVLVDEYQDTNHAQFRLVHALSAVHRALFVVGDDDQSIYRFRGADLSNVLDFESAFPGARTLRLEQNYRSTGTILRAANAVIAHNRSRRGKTLWCDREEGAPIRFVLTADEVDEARRIRRFLAERVARGGRLRDCAVLYRTNAQSRALETELRQGLIPYEIVGGVSFFQRREVKDLLAYLRLVANPADAVAFWRVWNTPRRGLGPAVRASVEERVRATGAAPIDALRELVAQGGLKGAARHGASAFLELVGGLRAEADAPVDALFALLLERTGYLAWLEGDENVADRRDNVQELGAAAAGFAATRGGALADFLAETALVTDLDRIDEDADRVLLLTAHNAKGLEFPVVVVAGLEEGLLPHGSSLEDPDQLEEERRLFYVALTRAQDEVLLTAAAFRRRFDGARGGAVSRFVDEVPADLLVREEAPAVAWSGRSGTERGGRSNGWHDGDRDDARHGATRAVRSLPVAAPPRGRAHRALGREVWHESFGRGVVIEAEGEGEGLRCTVRFGTKIRKVLGRFLSGGPDDD